MRRSQRTHGLPTAFTATIIRPEEYHWRVGRKVGRTIYLVVNRDNEPSDADVLIGMMDTPELAAEAVRAHNFDIDIRSTR